MNRTALSVPEWLSRGPTTVWQAVRWFIVGLLLWLAIASSVFAQSAGCQVTYTQSWEGGNGFGAIPTVNRQLLK